MTGADHDMPPRQPDEGEPVDNPARDAFDFIDETAARITDADVDEHLREVLGQAGYRPRHSDGIPARTIMAAAQELPVHRLWPGTIRPVGSALVTGLPRA